MLSFVVMNEYSFLFYCLLFVVAFLYASVGHGGASGYLALMALFSFSAEQMKSSAIFLNILVSAIAFAQYYHAGFFKIKLFFPFAISSIPSAFLGGMLSVNAQIYKKILAILLLFPIFRLMGLNPQERETLEKQNVLLSLCIGLVIGFLSGLIGIGGGIILSPVILLLRWANMKETAAVSALFILVNSLAGLGGLSLQGLNTSADIYVMLLVALSGGLLGSYLGAKKFKHQVLRVLLVSVLSIACIKLLFT